MEISQKKTKVTASIDGFDFLGWHVYIQKDNGKFKSIPSVENFKAFRDKVKHIVNNSNYGAKVKTIKLAPIVRGWRNYHKYCQMDGSRFSLWHLSQRTFKKFKKQKTINRYQAVELVKRAFPNISYSQNSFANVKGTCITLRRRYGVLVKEKQCPLRWKYCKNTSPTKPFMWSLWSKIHR